MKKLKSFLRSRNVQHWLGILTLMAISVAGVNIQTQSNILFTSTMSIPDHAPFDGTVYPIQENTDWATLTSSQYSMTYDELLDAGKIIDEPSCDRDVLNTPNSELGWSDRDDLDIRDAKIICTVRYAGSYEGAGNYATGSEDDDYWSGTHPAWDIKAPEGTPIHAIANGVVIKKSNGSGFGYHYVIQHNDVPDPNSPGHTTTLYSGYAHMLDAGLVNVGDVVTKGQVIGHVGTTGYSTTNHLHFQLDTATAPWHLYWPFSSADYVAAGLDYVSAIDEGLGWENMMAYTTDSLAYVEAHIDDTASEIAEEEGQIIDENTDDEDAEEATTEEATSSEETNNNTTTSTQINSGDEEIPESTSSANFSDIDINGKDFILTGESEDFRVQLLDNEGQLMKNADFDGDIKVTVSDADLASVDKSKLRVSSFDDGEAWVKIYSEQEGSIYLNFEWAGRTYTSKRIYLIDTIEPFSKFGVFTDGAFTPNTEEIIQVQTLDLEGRPTPNFYGDGTIELEILEGAGELNPSTLKSRDFLTGIAEVSLIPSGNDPIVIGLTYGKQTAESDKMYAENFTDIDENHPFYEALSYLYRKGDINGYPDKSFRPNNSVNRIEALKIIFEGLDQELAEEYNYTFSDTTNDGWYAPYLSTAVSRGIIKGYSDGTMRPEQGVNRVEFLKILFSTLDDVSVDPVVLGRPYNDVDTLAWYAPYVQYAKENNLFPNIEDEFDPGQEMSRIEVVEVIYRFIAVQQNGGEPYSVLMKPE